MLWKRNCTSRKDLGFIEEIKENGKFKILEKGFRRNEAPKRDSRN